MMYPDTDPKAWSFKHGVPLETDKCRKCGIVVNIDRPVITRDFVGFESRAHECGEGYVITLLKPTSKEILDLMKG